MDLVEIRKKAKALKDNKAKDGSKAKEKKSARKTVEGKGEEKPLAFDLTETDANEIEKLEGIEETAFADDSVPTDEIVEDQLVNPAEEEEPSDFLTRAMNALYEQSLETEQNGALEEEEDDEKLEYLCFMLSDEEYALDIKELREVINVIKVTEVPKTPSYVIGIISLRGNVIPLFDLRMRLGLEGRQYDSKTRILVVSNNGASMGLVVDRVTEVVKLSKSALEAPPTLINTVNADLLEGVGRYNDRLLIIPNLTKVLTLN